jgi:2-polyprenyl-3-methyl-5-hydroxy-6-metoxy-1,4-benzoquinol methylase
VEVGPDLEELRRRYGEEYFRSTFGVHELKRFSMNWWSVRFYAGVCRSLLVRHGPRLLEIGCGAGFILGALEREFDVTGVDVSEYALERCARHAPRARVLVGDIERGLPCELGSESFDVVLARYVLEHLSDPLSGLVEAARMLRPGGALFFAVPNTQSLGARRKGEDWYARRDPTHRSLLAPERWLELTRQAGLPIEREFSDGFWDLPYVSWLPRPLQALFFLPPSALSCLLARPLLPPRFGENVLVIARKPDTAAPVEAPC